MRTYTKFYLIIVFLTAAAFIFAQEEPLGVSEENIEIPVTESSTEATEVSEKESLITPFFSITSISTLNTNSDKDGKFVFEGFETEVDDISAGVTVQVLNWLTISPYLSNYLDITSGTKTLEFQEDTVEGGLTLGFAPAGFLGIDIGMAYLADFFADHIDNGFSAEAALNFSIDKAFLSFSFSDEINPMFCTTQNMEYDSYLENIFKAELTFLFFNFIKDSLNIGLYVSNELTTDSYWKNGDFYSTEFENELYAGLTFQPVEYFNAKTAFYTDILRTTDDAGALVDDTDTYNVGLYFELGLCVKDISASVSYNPILFSQNGSTIADAVEHEITFSIGYSF